MAKIILIALIIVVIIMFFKRLKMKENEKKEERRKDEIAMIGCHICNTFIDKKSAITNEEKHFCSITCLQKYKGE